MKIQEIKEEERPREKALLHGISSLANRELLALLLKTGTRKKGALDIADLLLSEYSLLEIAELTYPDLCHFEGINKAKALEIMAVFELSKRLLDSKIRKEPLSLNERDFYLWLRGQIGLEKQENFLVVYLNRQQEVIASSILFKGTVDESTVHPREIFKMALYYSAYCLVVAHNHPGGSIHPSNKDIEVTRVLVEAGKMMCIPVIDHYIVTANEIYSIRKNWKQK